MKKLLTFAVGIVLFINILPIALANDARTGIGINFETEDFKPLMWMCDSRKVLDDSLEHGRMSGPESPLTERSQNYAFEGETILWDILVMDKNKIEDVKDVFISIGPFNDARRLVPYTYYDSGCLSECISDYDLCIQGCYVPEYDLGCLDICYDGCTPGDDLCMGDCDYSCEIGQYLDSECVGSCESEKSSCDNSCQRTGMRLEENDIEAECIRSTSNPTRIPSQCNARIQEEKLEEFDPQTMAFYRCVFTIETPDSMYGEYWVTIESEDHGGLYNYVDEAEYWFLNPVIAVSVDNNLDFGIVRPGTISYSDTILVGNDADEGSGVLMDMFISGTDFYDPMSQGSRCVITNRLKLGDNYAASGLSFGNNDCDIGFTDGDDHLCYYASKGAYSTRIDPRNDNEGYVGIVYGDTFSRDYYNDAELIQGGPMNGLYYMSNILTPGAEIAVTFKLGLPEPCVGDFTDGDIYFWGEAI